MTSTYEVGYYYGGTPHNRIIDILPTVPESGVVAEEVIGRYTDEWKYALDQASVALYAELRTLVADTMSVEPHDARRAFESRRRLDDQIDKIIESNEELPVGAGLALSFPSAGEDIYLYILRTA